MHTTGTGRPKFVPVENHPVLFALWNFALCHSKTCSNKTSECCRKKIHNRESRIDYGYEISNFSNSLLQARIRRRFGSPAVFNTYCVKKVFISLQWLTFNRKNIVVVFVLVAESKVP